MANCFSTTIKKKIKMKNIVLILVFLFTLHGFSQNEENKWAVGLGTSSVLYSTEGGSVVGYRYIPSAIRFSLAKNIFKNVTLATAISSYNNDVKKYTSFDGEARYEFLRFRKLISIYGLIGGSYISEPESVTLNFGGGGTLWLSDKFGLRGQLMYKFNEARFSNQESHVYGSGGIVFCFSLGKGTGSGSNRKRIWESKH
jgi:hypothetical protein